MKFQLSIFLLFLFYRQGLSGYCKRAYSCTGTCSRREKTTTKCGHFGWDRCSRYKRVQYSCGKTCYKNVCCPNYTGVRCSSPMCFGSTSCPNGGRCASPNYCTCRPGFVSPRCTDVNECSSRQHRCNQGCINTHGSYRCSCRPGYRLLSDKLTCYDVNECKQKNGGCQQKCVNEPGSFKCDCNIGYKLNPDRINCSDVDECKNGNAGCQHGCKNTQGSFMCTCPKGFVLSVDQKTCEDEDECTKNASLCVQFCQNTQGSYKCSCKSGFILAADGRSCTAVNRCAWSNGGCQQICESEFGKLQCKCRSGFLLNDDKATCYDVDDCSKAPPLCEQGCTNTNGSYTCNCSQGYSISVDKRSCENVDDCKGVKCQNGGVCIDGVSSYTCMCRPGFSGMHCEKDINECSILNGGCEDLCQNSHGSFTCTCKKGRKLKHNGFSCSGPSDHSARKSVFQRRGSVGKSLPRGCHDVSIYECPAKKGLEIQMSSTSRWYWSNDNRTMLTYGITFVEINRFKIPFSLTGAKISRNLNSFVLSNVLQNESNIRNASAEYPKSSSCNEFHFSKEDMQEFVVANSFTETVFNGLEEVIPNWLKLRHSNESAVRVSDLRTDVVFGSRIDSIVECKGAPVLKDRVYSVFRFGSGFSISVYGDKITMPDLIHNNKVCLIVDICHDNGGTIFLMFPEESRDKLLELQLFKVLQSHNVSIRPWGIGISLPQSLKLNHHQKELILWNGERIFKYNLPETANLWIGGDFQYSSSGFGIPNAHVDAYVAIPSFNKILTSVFYDEWNVLLRISSKTAHNMKVDPDIPYYFNMIELKFLTVSISADLPVVVHNIDAFLSIGGQKPRRWCGDLANPPGFFLTTRISGNPFHDVPILHDLVFDLSAEVYFFASTKTNASTSPNVNFPTYEEVFGIHNITANVDKFLAQLKTHLMGFFNTSSPVIILQNRIISELHDIQGLLMKTMKVGELNHNQKIPRLFSEIWSKMSSVEAKLEEIGNKLVQISNATILSIRHFIKEEIRKLNSRVSKVLYELGNNIQSALQDLKLSEIGLKFQGGLRIFSLDIHALELEFFYSKGELMKCSRFDKIKQLLNGRPAIRVLGRVLKKQTLGHFIILNSGFGIELAVRLSFPDFEVVERVNAYFNILGIKVTADLFLTRKGISVYLEGNVWGIFYAQLDIHADLNPAWEKLAFTVRGRFVANDRNKRQTQAVTSSFQGSYLDALRRIIRSKADFAQKRLSQAQEAVQRFMKKLSDAQRWLDEKKRDIRNANELFDDSVESVRKARRKLQNAKGKFQRALEKLNSAQRKVDRLCKIRRCRKICIPGIKCKTCSMKIGWSKVSYPCCDYTDCMISFPEPICVLANIACSLIRAVAFAALEAAKVFIKAPIIALDAAEVALFAAEVVVDKSRVVLTIAEGALEVAKLGVEAVKVSLEEAKAALHALKEVIGAAAKILDLVIQLGIQRIVDVRNCAFEVKLKTVDLKIFGVSCEVNAFQLGWKIFRLRINFENILQSLWSAAKATINLLLETFGNTLLGRQKREVEFRVYSKMHLVLRKVRESGGVNNSTFTDLNDTVNEMNRTIGFNQNVTTDYEHRTSNFATKCRAFTSHFAFLNDTVNTLNSIATKSKYSIDLAEKVSSQLDDTSGAPSELNMTAEAVGIDVKYGKHYNLSEESIRKALKEAEPTINSNPKFGEVKNVSQFSQQIIKSEIESMDLGSIAAAWILAMGNITRRHFNKTECVDFPDCVLHSISNLYEIFGVDDHSNIGEVRKILSDLEEDILSIVQNSTYDIIGIHNTTTILKGNLQRLSDLNMYCFKPPNFISNLQNVTTGLYGNASFYCRVDSDPEANIWWYRGNALIEGENSSILTIMNVTEGEVPYKCVAGNVVANITSTVAYVLLTFVNESDVCSMDNGGCEYKCNNVNDTAQCFCMKGFAISSDLRSCADINECETGKDDCEQLCINTIGGYICSCKAGFTYNLTLNTCDKVKDDCELLGINCSETAGCTRESHDKPTCFCEEGYVLVDNGTRCEDIDQCALNTSGCSQGCTNRDGGYECFCNRGFFLEESQCHECEYPTWGDNCSQTCNCVAATKCDPVKGCICDAGWRGTKCEQDIDECAEDPDICNNTLKQCINQDGFYSCVCYEGYGDDGSGTCQDVKECSRNPTPCQQICTEEDGGYQCACFPGFALADDGKSCFYVCTADCKGQADGDYPSCVTRNGYVSCVGGISYQRPCPSKLVWDDTLKRCEWPDINT